MYLVPEESVSRDNDLVLGLFEEFLKDRRWLKNVTDNTLIWHRRAWRSYQVAGCSGLPTKADIARFVMVTRERGVSPVSVNTWLRSLKAFCAWLHAEGHLPTPVPISYLKTPATLIETLSDEQVRMLLQGRCSRRLRMLIVLLLDTGLRIEEALGLTWEDVDLENCLLRVVGKGRKERRVSFGLETRAQLRRYQKRPWPLLGHTDLVFPTRKGHRVSRDNERDALHRLQKRVGLPRFGFHRLRHTFATNFLRAGGRPERLQRILGHTTLTMTMRYVHLLTDDLKEDQQRTSLINRLGRNLGEGSK